MASEEHSTGSGLSPATQRIVFFGGAKVGKSSILRRFLSDHFSYRYHATIEDVHRRHYIIRGQHYQVEFLDTSGCYEFPAMRRLAISKASMFVLVFSFIDKSSLELLSTYVQLIGEVRPEICTSDKEYSSLPMPLIVVGNKVDLVSSRAIHLPEVKEWMATHHLSMSLFMPTSAKEDRGVREIFHALWQLNQGKELLSEVTELEDDDAESSAAIFCVRPQGSSRKTSIVNQGDVSALKYDLQQKRRSSAFAAVPSTSPLISSFTRGILPHSRRNQSSSTAASNNTITNTISNSRTKVPSGSGVTAVVLEEHNNSSGSTRHSSPRHSITKLSEAVMSSVICEGESCRNKDSNPNLAQEDGPIHMECILS